MVKKTFKKLSPELVDALGALKKERKKLQAQEQVLIDASKEFIEAGHPKLKKTVTKGPDGKKTQLVYSPKGAEYEFVYSKFQCLDVKWRELYEALYQKVNGKKALKRHLKGLPRREQTQLDVNER